MSFIPLDQIRSLSSDSSQAISHQPSAIRSSRRLPPWFKVQAKTGPDYLDIKQTMDRPKLHTICEEARCPNRHLHQTLPLLFSRNRPTASDRS